MAATLTYRLLCAARMSYGISGNAAPVSAGVNDQPAGFVAPPVGFVAGERGIDACMVGTSGDGVILAFRGTLPPDDPNHEKTLDDWLNDLDAVLETQDGIQGKVHQGFWDTLSNLWVPMLAEVKKQLAAKPAANLYITGHSKGGAVAALAAARLVAAGLPCSITVCTFAAAHPGNQDFADFYGRYISSGRISSSTRYEYADDIVPHLPPGLALRHALSAIDMFDKYIGELSTRVADDIDFAGVGTLRFINWDGNVVGDSAILPISRAWHLADLIVKLSFDQIVHDHSIDVGSGYDTAIAHQ
jgi:hypothetical protein